MSQARFDAAAATWDEQPARIALAGAIAEAVRRQAPLHAGMTALDFGCGTGLLTLALQPDVRRITGIDTSPNMLEKLREKMAALALDTVDTLLLDLTAAPPPPGLQADLIVSAMALHHVPEISPLLRVLSGLLAPVGWLALADLDAEDGSFHADPSGVYHAGIDRDWLMGQLAALGLSEIRATTAHVVERPDVAGVLRRYPVFLVSARRDG